MASKHGCSLPQLRLQDEGIAVVIDHHSSGVVVLRGK